MEKRLCKFHFEETCPSGSIFLSNLCRRLIWLTMAASFLLSIFLHYKEQYAGPGKEFFTTVCTLNKVWSVLVAQPMFFITEKPHLAVPTSCSERSAARTVYFLHENGGKLFSAPNFEVRLVSQLLSSDWAHCWKKQWSYWFRIIHDQPIPYL